MGLAVSTDFLAYVLEKNDADGATWFRRQLELVNKLLAAAGLPTHLEPQRRGPARERTNVGIFPYSLLHFLRRAFARVREGVQVVPVAEDEDPAEDPAIESASTLFDTHLLCHSDADGFYVPVDFDEVICDAEELGLAGGMLGSSVRLMAELVEVASAIGIVLQGSMLSNEEAEKLAAEDDDEGPFCRERMVWLTLFENARVSIENKTMVVFS